MWSERWLLRFHPEKCSVLKVGTKKSEASYRMNSTVLANSEVERDLGVLVDNNLCFRNNVAQMSAKANRVVGIIHRSFDCLKEPVFVQLHKALVRPLLEYGHSAWQPYNKTLCAEVEDVQRRATKLLASLSNLDYPARLAALHLPRLEHRRKRGDLIDCYKYVHGVYNTASLFKLSTSDRTRGHSLKLVKEQCSRQVRLNFFSVRVVNVWNSLPELVVSAPSVNSFKSCLDAHWSNLATKYDPDCYH
ncbi:hypothetical protein HAZT_HAZT004540 [Hyalella azteca]|uniref:Uncharacterized protein n=1 Tax=Hyalella azteca TaxID=294128 RepID=A0A6A0H051_HYAAZ|nr:hypothetical protein HAZT_HAZT004540 [Hyalella azteca]